MFLYFFNDILLLNLSFEAAKGVLERFTFLYPYFRHTAHTSSRFEVYGSLGL